ncbi:Tautomerase/MIF [Marasmius fiardii PR-910]|nr:Tautomerase/MIF [Marasmius fiardii PR-910]
MPFIRVETNVKVADEKGFILGFSKLAAEVLGMDEKLFGVILQQDDNFSFGGTFDPCFNCTVLAIAIGSPGVNRKISQAFTKYLEDKLGVSNDRGYIFMENPVANNVSFKGDTADIVFAK